MTFRSLSLRTRIVALIACTLAATALPLVYFALDFLWEHQTEKMRQSLRGSLDVAEKACTDTMAKVLYIKAVAMEKARRGLERGTRACHDIIAGDLGTRSPESIVRSFPVPENMRIFFVRPDGSVIGGREILESHDIRGVSLADIHHFVRFSGSPEIHVFQGESSRILVCLMPVKGHDLLLGAATSLAFVEATTRDSLEAQKANLVKFVEGIDIDGRGGITLLRLDSPDRVAGRTSPFTREEHDDIATALAEGRHRILLDREGRKICLLRAVPRLNLLLVASVPANHYFEQTAGLVLRESLLFVVLLLLAIGLTGWLAMRMFAPLGRLADVAAILPTCDYTRPVSLDTPLPVERNDEIGNLARSLSHFTELLHENVRNVVEMTAARERLENELRIAARIQEGILPRAGEPAGIPGFSLAGRILPEKEVGGDLFDYFPVGRDRLCLAIGDVSGHGVPAALFMSSCVTLLRGIAGHAAGPARAAEAINRTLAARNSQDMFVSLLLGFYDVPDGTLTFCLAGHPPPILIPADGGPCRIVRECRPDLVIGLMEDAEYADHTLRLAPGDTLFLHTDGISEAVNPAGGFFGEERLVALLERERGGDPETLAEATLEAVQAFADGAEANDDRTLLILQRWGNAQC